QATLARYEGYLLQFIVGDKGNYLYATFGAPLAHENDAARAASAALELRSPPAELDFIRAVQIGLSQGTMRTGAYGGTQRRTYGVIGDDVNLAARLMQAAAPGEVLASGHVQRAIAAGFTWEAMPAVQVKGKAQSIPVARLAGKQPARETIGALFRHYSSALVGREAELARLEPALDQALGGEGQIVRLEGGTGVGKSHLAAEFARRAAGRGLRVCLGTCQAASQNVSYTAWQQVFWGLLGLAEEAGEEEDVAVANARNVARVQAAIERLNPAWAIRLPLLGDLLDLPIPDNATTAVFDPRLRQEALFALAVELVQAYARQRPLLLLVEDAHWMDEASQGLTLALGRVIASSPALLMLVHRPPLQDDKPILPELERLPNHRRLDLSELSPEGIAALVTNRLSSPSPLGGEGWGEGLLPSPGRGGAGLSQPGVGGGEVISPLALSLIQARAQGNPFFAEELVDALREAEHLVCLPPQVEGGQSTWTLSDALVSALREANCLQRDPAGGDWVLCPEAQLSAAAIDIPGSVHGAVLSRLDRLPELHKLTLKVASVIGRAFELDVLAGANPAKPGHKMLQTQLDTFEKRDFTRLELPPPHVVYIFKHNITQEVVYDALLGAQQRELHRAVGEVLETLRPDAAEPLAHHFSQGSVDYKAQFYLDRAARKAQREYANETALNYYAQALALEERWEWRRGQIEVLHVLGRRVEELAALQALEVLPDAPAGTVAELWGAYYEAVGDYPQAQAAVERALSASREQANRVGEASSLAQLGLIARRQGDYERAMGWYAQALGLFQAGEEYSANEAAVFASAFNGLGVVHRQQGVFDEAKACYEQSLALSRQTGNRKGEAEALNSLGGTVYYQRNFTQALVHYRQAIEISRSIGDRAGEGTSLYNLALAIQETGDYSRAEEHLLSALIIQQIIGNRWEESNILNGLGILYHTLGKLSAAQDRFQKGLNVARQIGDEAGQAYILINLALVARDHDDLDTAQQLLNEGLQLAQKADRYIESGFLSELGIVTLKTGRLEQAIDWAEAALALRRELDMHVWTTDNLATLAAAHWLAGRASQALDFANQALHILDECGGQGPQCPQQDLFMCYQVLAAAGEAKAASNALQSAHQLVMARADKIADLDLRRSFLENVPINRQIVEEADREIR
ncbi:MAG: tetratricopeptide repeat protein, partial [Thermoflexales bacterium]|nr:tetratricopeptide repeat protein [Thermoflexales bacterium]